MKGTRHIGTGSSKDLELARPPDLLKTLSYTPACWKSILALWLSLSSATGAAATNRLTAEQVLARFAEMQDQVTSFIAEYEVSRQDVVLRTGSRRSEYWLAGETRYDGKRVRERDRSWGQITPDTARSKDKPYYRSRLFDGHWRYQYEQPFWRVEDSRDPRQAAGQLLLRHISAEPIPLPRALQEGGLYLAWGVLPHDHQRIDVRLREAATLQVRDKLQVAGSALSPCYVLEGHLPDAQHYTVWLDPAHGFQMAKGILRRTAGYRPSSTYTLQSGEYDLGFVEKVRFAKNGDVWVPVEAVGGLDNVRKGYRSSMRFQLKTTRFLLNPDHEHLRSFVPDDIRNGTAVYAQGRTNARGSIVRDEWRDGHVVDRNGNMVLTPSARLIERPTAPQPTPIKSPGKTNSFGRANCQ